MLNPGRVGLQQPPVDLELAQRVDRDGALGVDGVGFGAQGGHPGDAERADTRPSSDRRGGPCRPVACGDSGSPIPAGHGPGAAGVAWNSSPAIGSGWYSCVLSIGGVTSSKEGGFSP